MDKLDLLTDDQIRYYTQWCVQRITYLTDDLRVRTCIKAIDSHLESGTSSLELSKAAYNATFDTLSAPPAFDDDAATYYANITVLRSANAILQVNRASLINYARLTAEAAAMARSYTGAASSDILGSERGLQSDKIAELVEIRYPSQAEPEYHIMY